MGTRGGRSGDYNGKRRGYTIPAAWDEGTLIQAMARLDDPTLRWRYGDVAAEAQDEAEVSVEREDE